MYKVSFKFKEKIWIEKTFTLKIGEQGNPGEAGKEGPPGKDGPIGNPGPPGKIS